MNEELEKRWRAEIDEARIYALEGRAILILAKEEIQKRDELLEKAKIEIEELKSLIKEAIPHVKKSLDSIFEIDLRFSHMIKNKEACEKWLEKAEKIK